MHLIYILTTVLSSFLGCSPTYFFCPIIFQLSYFQQGEGWKTTTGGSPSRYWVWR